ncbi:MAG: WYL domain-containing protein [Prevotella sp.]|nr:WYL domain-containing protein [Prevotella sp.]
MPVDRQVLLRYQVLNKCFRNRYKEFTIDDLVNVCNVALVKADSTPVSKRTIQNDITNLETEYGIRLDKTMKRGRQRLYRYCDIDYSIPLFRMNDEERDKIEDAIYVLKEFEGEPLYDWARSLLMQIEGGYLDEDPSPVVSFQFNPDLKGLSHFSDLLRAIITKRVLKLHYTPYGKDTQAVTIFPYHLKQYNDRWYLIAQREGYQNYAHYALDRIDNFEEVAIPYRESGVDFSEYFDDVVGVTVPESNSEDVVLRISKPRFEYIRTKPLHLSQRIMEENDYFSVISINVKINKELEALVLSFGNDMEVLSPEGFRMRIAEEILSMNQQYNRI